MTRIIVRRADLGPDCSLCRDAVSDLVGEVACPGCGARYHGACLEELATRCATLGCDALRVVARAAPRSDGTWFLLAVPVAVFGPLLLVFAASGATLLRAAALVGALMFLAVLALRGLAAFAEAITPPPRGRS